MPRCTKRAGRLGAAQFIAIHAAARGVVDEISALTVVNRKVDIRAILLSAHERSSFDASKAGWQLRAVRRCDQRRGKVVVQANNSERRATIGYAADNQLAVIHRRHTRTGGKTKINNTFLGNTRDSVRVTRAITRNRQHMQLAVARDQIGMAAIRRKHAGGVNKSPDRNASEHIARRLVQHLNSTSAGGNQNKAVAYRSTRPVIALIGVDMLPRNSARQDVNARQTAVVVRTRVRVDINSANVEIVAINRQPRIRLGRFAYRVSNPNRRERVGRQSLNCAAIERNDDQAIRINRTRGVTDRSLKIRLGKNLARLGINLKQTLVDGKIHIALHDDRLARVDARCARVDLPIKRPRACQRARRRGHVLDHRIGIATPVGFPIGRA